MFGFSLDESGRLSPDPANTATMLDRLRLASGVIALIGIAVLLLYEQIDFLDEGEATIIATVAIGALVAILIVRYLNYRDQRQT